MWCGCHHHCAPFPPTTTTVCAAPPCPLCVCVLVVGLGTAAHCGGTHAGVALCLAPGHHTHLPRCPRLSPLSSLRPPNPTLPHTHTNGTAHSTHTWRALCASSHPLTHSLVASLPTHPPHTLVGVRVLIHLLSCAITHTAQAQAWRLPGCFGVVVTTTTPLVPHAHRDWWWAPWWWLVVGVWALCGCHATPPTRLACHHTRHIHHHTHHGVLFVWHALPLPPPHNPITHTPQQPLCHNGGCHWSPRRPHTPHTCHTRHTHTKGKHRRGCGFWCGTTTTLVLAIRCLLFFPSCPPTPFPLSLACTHTPSSPHQQHHHPIHPLCVVCVLWEWTDGWTTLWLSTPHTALLMGVLIGDTIQPFHPPSPLSLCFCPPPTTTPSLFSAHTTQRRKGEWG